MAEPEDYCRELALTEPIAGTAQGEIERWIVIEDNGPWGAKVPAQTRLPADLIEWLKVEESKPRTRVQLIRRPGAPPGGRRAAFFARTPADPAGRKLVELDCWLHELPGLDVDTLLDTTPPISELAALWLVCTHGARDRCCAKWGIALWEALREREGDRVWQCSHLGGHRFAPTALALPSGLAWGRLSLDEVEPLVRDVNEGRIGALSKLRGRSAYPSLLQAAEAMLRLREGISEDNALTLRESVRVDAGECVRFSGPGGTTLEIVVDLERPGFVGPASCGEDSKPRPFVIVR